MTDNPTNGSETAGNVAATEPTAVSPSSPSAQPKSMLERLISDDWRRIFLPDDAHEQLLPGEEMLLEIHLAWYRNFAAQLIYSYPFILFLIAVVSSVLGFMLAPQFRLDPLLTSVAPWALLTLLCLYALYERFTYLQWRLVKTDQRIIITMPQPGTWYLVDTIEMSNNPSVLDENWSDSGLRRMFQALTGARDLYISLVGLQFDQGTARVKDALVIPDVSHEDVVKLKTLVFAKK